ncbi:hypothetical protein H6801_00640 [Candidatus Nomurabacteria bacterium]|nr:hypothetical protein [Candidatus Saccharibacteria bacterium]MCB9821870.1 hypothetical protein [Candidatus Nomurabacteria bacterium]
MTKTAHLQIMKYNDTYNSLNKITNLEDYKLLLGKFLYGQLDAWKLNPHNGREIAYEIAGMLSTGLALGLPDDDPYMEVLLMAGELELPDEHKGEATWEELAGRIEALQSKS